MMGQKSQVWADHEEWPAGEGGREGRVMENPQWELTTDTKAGVMLTKTKRNGKWPLQPAALSTGDSLKPHCASSQPERTVFSLSKSFMLCLPPSAALPDAIQVGFLQLLLCVQ